MKVSARHPIWRRIRNEAPFADFEGRESAIKESVEVSSFTESAVKDSVKVFSFTGSALASDITNGALDRYAYLGERNESHGLGGSKVRHLACRVRKIVFD